MSHFANTSCGTKRPSLAFQHRQEQVAKKMAGVYAAFGLAAPAAGAVCGSRAPANAAKEQPVFDPVGQGAENRMAAATAPEESQP